jgi:hypothetical protein
MNAPVQGKAITADGAVKGASGGLVSVLLTAGDSAAATLVLYDNSAASGTVVATLKTAQATSVQWSPASPVAFSLLFADITGDGAAAYVALT